MRRFLFLNGYQTQLETLSEASRWYAVLISGCILADNVSANRALQVYVQRCLKMLANFIHFWAFIITKASPETIFTLSAGRTGTAWLSDFLAVNFNYDAVHEPLGIEVLGNRMPDIKIMRSFNETGNNAIVKDFWKLKLSMLTSHMHIETNHTLGKCGLIENISRTRLAEKSKIIILKRDIVR